MAAKRLRVLKDPLLIAGLLLLVFVTLISAVGPLFVKWNPIAIDLQQRLKPPSPDHLLGTDEMGRDVLSRILTGGRISLSSAVFAIIISAAMGIILGLTAGTLGGPVDLVIMRFIDFLLAFPTLLLAIIVVSILGTGLENAIIAITIARIPLFARVARASTMQVKEQTYIEAARAVGASIPRIMFLHVLVNIISPLIVAITLQTGHAIILLSTLGFLGLGAQPPSAEWGLMLSQSRIHIYNAPHLLLPPGFMIASSVLGLNLVGDGIRDMLDPRQARKRRGE